MSNTPDPQIEFGATVDEEHSRIREAGSNAVAALWILGKRLLRFRANFGWQKLTAPEAPFKDFSDYLARGTGVSPSTAYRAMDAARLPYWCSEELGIERTAILWKITELTTVDESPEQAMELQLPLAKGGTKPVTAMTVLELQTAYALLRHGKAQAERPDRSAEPTASEKLQQTAAAAVAQWLEPAQVRAHRKNQGIVLDLEDVPHEQAADVFSALARAMRP